MGRSNPFLLSWSWLYATATTAKMNNEAAAKDKVKRTMNTEHGYWGWGLAIIVIVAVSWAFYRYVAPKSWREWGRAGLVQAFIISLYAEMYGFPLTIYLLARVFNLDATKNPWTGNLWSYLLGSETGMVFAMVIGYALALLGICLLAVGWRQVCLASREGRLATDGLYGVVRHPQYTGIFLALFGEGVVHWPTIFSLALFPVIVAAYVWAAHREERRMIDEFGEEYRAYQRRVPMFLPRPGEWGRLLDALKTSLRAGRKGTSA